MIENYLIVNGEEMAVGHDISHYNEEINWDTLKSMFLYIKSSQGYAYTDPAFTEHRKNAITHGIPQGAYHFYDYRYPDGLPQAMHMVKCVGDKYGELKPAVDFEDMYENVGTKKKPKQKVIPKPPRNQCYNELMEMGYYLKKTYGTCPRLYIGNLLGWLKPDQEMIDLYYLWMAQWKWVQDGDKYGYPKWNIWQRIGDVKIAGQPGVWDINYIRKADYLALFSNLPVPVETHWYDGMSDHEILIKLAQAHEVL